MGLPYPTWIFIFSLHIQPHIHSLGCRNFGMHVITSFLLYDLMPPPPFPLPTSVVFRYKMFMLAWGISSLPTPHPLFSTYHCHWIHCRWQVRSSPLWATLFVFPLGWGKKLRFPPLVAKALATPLSGHGRLLIITMTSWILGRQWSTGQGLQDDNWFL